MQPKLSWITYTWNFVQSPVSSCRYLFTNDRALTKFTGTPYDELYVQIARLMLDVLQLYSNTEAGNQIELIQLFTTASNLVVVVNTLDHTTNITSYAPNYLLKSICLAAFMLLRLVKSYFGPILDADVKEEGKSALFVAINLLKQMSLVNNDICAKAADSLSATWTDQIVFKVTDLSSWGKLRIRNELSISVVFDSILAWVETYGCNDVVSAQLRTQSDSMMILNWLVEVINIR